MFVHQVPQISAEPTDGGKREAANSQWRQLLPRLTINFESYSTRSEKRNFRLGHIGSRCTQQRS